MPQQPRRQEQDGLDQGQNRGHRDADQAQWDAQQPHEGPNEQNQERHRPAQKQQNAPADQQQQCAHGIRTDGRQR